MDLKAIQSTLLERSLDAWLFYDHPPIRERLAMAEDMPLIY